MTESGDISSNLVRFSPDLEKSHWILGKYHQNLENYHRNLGFFAGSMFFSSFSRCVLRSMTSTNLPATRWWSEPSDSITPAGWRWVHFFPTQFRRDGSGFGTNSTRIDPWTALITRGALQRGPASVGVVTTVGGRTRARDGGSGFLAAIPNRGRASTNTSPLVFIMVFIASASM